MLQLPPYVPLVFIFTTIATVGYFISLHQNRLKATLLFIVWLVLQGCIALTGFYTMADTMPPRFLLLIAPPFLTIAMLFFTPAGRRYIDGLSPAGLTLLHLCRIPVELVLLWLFIGKAVPCIMTFEGNNLDIISGLTAPVIYYFGFVKKLFGRRVLIAWNIICLALLANIVGAAILSAPFRFQQFAFGQPNIGVLYFPYIWLPCCIVPLVLFSHLATLRQLFKQ